MAQMADIGLFQIRRDLYKQRHNAAGCGHTVAPSSDCAAQIVTGLEITKPRRVRRGDIEGDIVGVCHQAGHRKAVIIGRPGTCLVCPDIDPDDALRLVAPA